MRDQYVRRGGAWVARRAGMPALTVTTPPTRMTRASGIWGAGFQNSGDVHPADSALLLSGGDVGGVHLSHDGGDTWAPNNAGLSAPEHLRTVSVRWSTDPATPTRAWMHSVGTPGSTSNYLWRGEYDPATGSIVRWDMHMALPTVWARAGNGPESGDTLASASSGHPRQTGRGMLALDEVAGWVYLGSRDGLWRVRVDGTGTPQRIWGAGLAVTSIALDPVTAGTAYVTVDLGPVGALSSGVGLYQVTGIRGTVTQVAYVTAGMVYPQCVVAHAEGGVTRLFVATGKRASSTDQAGSVLYHPGGSITAGWIDISGALSSTETSSYVQWCGLDAVRRGDGTWTVAVGNISDPSSGQSGKAAWCVFDGSTVPSWTRADSQSEVSYDVATPGGPTWWLSGSSTHSFLMADRRGFDARPVIDPNAPDTIIFYGRSGIWRLKPSVSTRMHPIVRGLAVTTSKQVRIDRADATRLLCGDVDWSILRLSNGGITDQPWSHSLPSTLGSTAKIEASGLHALADGRMAWGGGDAGGNSNGGLFVGLPFASPSGDWTDELGTGAGRPWTSWADTPWCLGQGVSGTGAGQVILAALNATGTQTDPAKTGLWRKTGTGASGTWVKVPTGPAMTSSGVHVEIEWLSSTVVWMVESKTGLWQSLDAGVTWANRYAASWTSRYTGHLRADPTRPGTLWAVTKGTECWRITDALTSTPTRVAGCPPATTPAGVAVDATTGSVYVAEQGTPRLWGSEDGGETWSDLTTPSYQSMCFTVKDMDAHDGVLATAMFAGYALTELP